MNKYLINSQDDIIILKHNLMETAEGTSTISESKDKNAPNAGEIFEVNVRETLINEYNFDESCFPRCVLSRKIYNEDRSISKTILSAKNEIIRINNVDYLFQLNDNCSISIFDKDNLIKIIKDLCGTMQVSLNEEIIFFQHHEELEVDGILVTDNNFKLSMFNKNEIFLIYSNINIKEENTFKIMVLEIKLKAEYLFDLIVQLKRDAKFFNSLSAEKIVFIGFVGSGKVDYRLNFKDLLGNIKCALYLITNNKLCGRNLKVYIDWTTVNRVKKLTEKINRLDYKMNVIMEHLGIKMEDNEKNRANNI